MKERNYVIYALIDPRDGSVRYVGISDNMPTRFMQHLRETGSRTAKGMWLEELRRCGLQPTIKILEEMQVEERQRYLVEERERHWIRAFEQSGASLTNIRDTLVDTRKPSNKDQEKLYGRKILANSLRGLGDSTGLPTLDQLRIHAGLRVNELADLAGISTTTLREMINGVAVSHNSIFRVLRVLSRRLGYDIAPNKVRGLRGL